MYLHAEYSRAQAEPAVHAAAILARGKWIPGVIDPRADGASQHSGERLIEIYTALGLTLTPADNAVEPGSCKSGNGYPKAVSKSFVPCSAFCGKFASIAATTRAVW